ncbi:hypothetical protein JXB22_08585 [candidate division WOR-3 bacterium]|nr:hypothetical protein [candidate division WOR-3 bacterium]
MQNALPYVQRTNDLGKCVHDISRHLTQQNSALIDLTQRLESLFDLFSRGNELLKIMQQYSASLQHDITNVRKMHASYKQTVETIALHMESVQDHLQSITDLLVALHENAGSFISSAQTLGHLAKNTEIRAYHAKREGKGLGIIATECLSLAKQAQLPFHDFSSVLKDLEEVALPVIQELDTVIDLSEWSRHLFDTSLKTLETIDNATTTLQAIVKRVEENSALSTALQANIDTGLSTLKGQMVLSLTAIDDLSIRCSHIQSQAHIVNTLHNMLAAGTEELPHDQERRPAIQHHYDHYLQESIRSSSRFMNVKKLPVFSSEVFQSILSMEKQVKTLNASVQDITQYRDYVGTGMNEVHSLAQQILDFLGKAQTMYEHLHGLGANLHAEVQKIETLMGSTTKIFNKLKTLTTFARIEEGRSMQYQDIIGPIVQNFVDLEIETEQAFALFAPKLAQLKKNIQFLRTQREMIRPEQLKYPDYSKIKLFLDDIVRVFIEEHKQIAHIARSAEDLYKNNTILEHDWQRFQTITSTIQEITGSFTAQAPRYEHGPALGRTRTKITLCLTNDPITLLPDKKTDITSHQVIGNMSCGLFQFGEGVDVIPALCEDYTISDDGLVYTFTLRSDLKYQNGKPLMIEAIKEGFINALQGPNFSLFDMIEGAKEFIATKDRSALGIHILNERTLQLRLEYPFLPILANCATNIADPYIIDTLLIGAGPFRLVEYEQGAHLVLAANVHYFEGRPPIDELHFSIIEEEMARYPAFQKGLIDIFHATGEVLRTISREQPHILKTIPELSVQYLVMNCRKAPFTNVLVRKALCHAIDIRTMVQRFNPQNAIPARGLFPPSVNVANPNVKGYAYDVQQAKAFLAQAGYPNGLPDVYTFDARDNASVLRRAEFVKACLTDVGIRVNINPMPWNELLTKQYSGDSMLSFGGWVGDNGDPDNFVYTLFHSSSQGRSGNMFFFGSDQLDALMDTARKTRNVEKRTALYREIEQRIIDQAPCLFLYHRLQNIAVRREIIGFKPHPLGFLRVPHVYSPRPARTSVSRRDTNDHHPAPLVS